MGRPARARLSWWRWPAAWQGFGLTAPLLVALLVRLACLPLGQQLVPQGESAAGLTLAREYLAQGQFTRLPEGLLPPLHRLAIAPALSAGHTGDAGSRPPEAWPGVMLLNIAVDLLAAVLLMALVLRRYGPRAAAAAGWIFALYVPEVLFSATTVAPAPFTTLAAAALLTALDALDRRLALDGAAPWIGAALVGLCAGLGVLTDELLLLGVPVAVLLLLLRSDVRPSRRLGVAALIVGVALAVPSPWAEHNRRHFGSPVLSGTSQSYAALVANAPPGENGELLWAGLPGVSERLATAREVRRRALFEYPALTAARAADRLRVLLGPESRLPAWFAASFDAGPAPRGDAHARLALGWQRPAGSAGRVVQLLGGLCVLLLFSLAAAGVVASAGDALGRAAWLTACIVSVSALLGSAGDQDRHALLAFAIPPAALALDLLTQSEPLAGRRARRALAAGLVAAGLLTLTLFLLPAP